MLLTVPQLVVPLSLAGALLSATLPALVYAWMRRDPRGALWAFAYAGYSLLGLGWIQLLALVTPHRSAWLTRQLPQSAEPAQEPRVSMLEI